MNQPKVLFSPLACAFIMLLGMTSDLFAQAQITTEPSSIRVCDARSAQFQIHTNGILDSIRWQLNTGSGWAILSSGTDSSLVYGPVDRTMDAYLFRAIVYSSGGNDTSNAAGLTVFGNQVLMKANITHPSGSGGNGSLTFLSGWSPSFTATGTTGTRSVSYFNDSVVLTYAANGGGIFNTSSTFTDNSGVSGTLTFSYSFSGCHSWFQSQAYYQVWVGNTSNIVANLYAGGSCPFGGNGTVSFNVSSGQSWGVLTSGSHFDASYILTGTISLFDFKSNSIPALRYARLKGQGINYPLSLSELNKSNLDGGAYYLFTVDEENCPSYNGPFVLQEL